MESIMGIYEIRNTTNDKIYIGSSNNISLRWKQHISKLNKNKHHNFHLQKAWNKYSKDSFKFKIIELVEDDDLLFSAEQKWINKTKCYDGNFGYNLSVEATRPNVKHNKESHLNCNLVFRDYLNELIEMNLNKNEKLVYYVLREFITHPTNCIMINDEIPTFTQLEPILSLTERSIRDALKTLQEKNLLKLVQSGHRKAIYINPKYYGTGTELNITTLQMFGLIDCDDDKVDYYLENQ